MRSKVYIALFIGFALIVGCAGLKTAGHKYFMNGQILKTMDNNQVYLCIGTNNGATVGQQLTVYRNTEITSYRPGDYPVGKPRLLYDRKETGKIEISEIVNEHYSIAKVISGDVKANDIAELMSH